MFIKSFIKSYGVERTGVMTESAVLYAFLLFIRNFVGAALAVNYGRLTGPFDSAAGCTSSN